MIDGMKGCVWFLAVVAAAGLAGCGGGPERAEVQGTVTYDGQPVENGSIAFMPAEGVVGPAVSGTIQGGKYHLTGNQAPAVGMHRVRIIASRSTGRQVPAGEGAEDPSAMVDEIEMYIPHQYNNRTILTANIEAGSNEHNFNLKGEAAGGASHNIP